MSNQRTISDVQSDFGILYPFLRLEFSKVEEPAVDKRSRKYFPQATLLLSAGLKKEGYVELNDTTTVAELIRIIRNEFGLIGQVCRNAGGMWLETTMTDNWTLYKQNEYGKEILQDTKRGLAG